MGMKKLAQGAITTGGGTTLYTTPTGMRTEVLDLCIANTTNGALTAAIHLVPTGASASTANMLFPTVTIPANTLIQWTGSQVLNAGDFIQGIGSASGITVTASGLEGRAGT
jgi:hypothetical protein